jgi:hypothetical protein
VTPWLFHGRRTLPAEHNLDADNNTTSRTWIGPEQAAPAGSQVAAARVPTKEAG